MCGKFTAKASWRGIVDFAWSQAPLDGDDDVTYRVMQPLPVIVFHDGTRRVMPMRWGFPDPKDWRKPRPIHARSETIDTMPAFADAFRDGQRGIVQTQTFNEAPENGAQHVITPTGPVGIAVVWRRFVAGDQAMLACVMATVAANRLIAGLPTDRMPAVLDGNDWDAWLTGSPDEAKACLKTVEDVRWTMAPEQRKREKPTVRDPVGLF